MKEKSEPAAATAGSVQLADPGGSALLHSQFSRQGDSGQNEDTQDGLVNAIISVRKDTITDGAVGVVLGGGLRMKRRTDIVSRQEKPRRASGRGAIYGFSQSSHRRLLSRIMRIDWQAGEVYFTTLTYHRVMQDCEQWQKDRVAFVKRLRRAYADAFYGLLWRVEFQRRGSVHFHCTLHWRAGLAPDLASFRQWVSLAWNQTAEPGDAEHLKSGTNVQIAVNTEGEGMARLLNYLAKYLTKAQRPVSEEGEILPTGRIWGVVGKIPEKILYGLKMTAESYVLLARRLRRWGRESWYLSRLTGQWQGMRVLYDGALVSQLLRGLEWVRVPVPEGLI